jgi:hypothetical protein
MSEVQMTNLKRLDLFYLDLDSINKISAWDFNICAVEQAEKLRYTWALFHLCNYIEFYQIDREVFYQFLVVL